jgi:putative transposase
MRLILTNPIWELLGPLVDKAKRSRAGAKAVLSDRMFLEALLYLTRTGLPWRDLPADFGDWNAVYQRFKRWRLAGVFERLFADLPREHPLDEVRRLFVDTTVIRAHPHAAGAQKKSTKTKKLWDEVGAGMGPRSI